MFLVLQTEGVGRLRREKSGRGESQPMLAAGMCLDFLAGWAGIAKAARCSDITIMTFTLIVKDHERSICIMDAIDLLKSDHEKVKELFRKYEAAADRAYQKKKGIAEEVFTEITVHSTLEEELFYPAVKTQVDKEGQALVAESIEEHHVVAMLIEELRALDPKDERYDAKFSVLMENVEHHIEEEEEELFPEAEEVLGDTIADLGAQMQERKEQLITSLT
jgi:hemerythrin-like domain-containing protein